MNTFEEKAVNAVRDYLIELLKEGQWGRVRQVSDALTALVEGKTPRWVLESPAIDEIL